MRKLFFPYLLANYPSPGAFADIFDLTLPFADTIEVGLPFSDPVADGPVLSEAAGKVLESGFQVDSVLRFLESRIRACREHRTSIAVMTYANPVLAYGRSDFSRACRQSGVQSLIVPDVPFEECGIWKEEANAAGLNWIQFVSLVTQPDRLQRIAATAEGFVYLLSLTGITGARIGGQQAVQRQAREIRRHTDVPVALGFGIKSPEDIVSHKEYIDAFIVGSQIVEWIHRGVPLQDRFREFQAALGGQ